MNSNEATYVTAEGLQKMQSDLTHLIEVKRAEVAERLDVALSHGDLDENADYDDVLQEQALVEGRIAALEDAIRHAEVIDESEQTCDCVRVGHTVSITEVGEEDVETFRIVGVHEASPADGLISHVSPIATALLGAKVGESVVAATPGGDTTLQVVSIA